MITLDYQVDDMIKTLDGFNHRLVDIMNNQHLLIELNKMMNHHYVCFIQNTMKMDIKTVMDGIITRLLSPQFCFAGGYGHSVFSHTIPFHPHWCVRPEHYPFVKLSPLEELVIKMAKKDLRISPIPAGERWGN